MVQELRVDGELNNYTKYLVCVCVCVCVGGCVCVQSFQQDLQHITWCSLQVCPPQQMQELSVLFFCPLHHLHVPLFTPELLVPAAVCGFVSGGTAAGD